jgi:DNA invertase Pin-like site-specific DNA recombinase
MACFLPLRLSERLRDLEGPPSRALSPIIMAFRAELLYIFLQENIQSPGREMAKSSNKTKAIAYMRTSSATNVGADTDSEKRQRAAITAFARARGYEVVDWFYDPAVSGADPIGERPGFRDMLDRIAANGVRTIIVESPDRFARDLTVQLTGHDFLKGLGISLIPATAPDFFVEDTPTAVLVRQVLGAIAQFEKASLVAKMKAARDRKIAAGEKCGGRRSHAELRPEVVALAQELRRKRRKRGRLSLRGISAELAARGHSNGAGRPFSAISVNNMLKMNLKQSDQTQDD